MYYVYILSSTSHPGQIYIGATADLRQRLADHNAGRSPHTSKFVPWQLACYISVCDRETVYSLESYLKSHSGRAFAKKRLLRRSDNSAG